MFMRLNDIKTKIRFLTDIVSTVIFILYSVFLLLGEILQYKAYILWPLILIITSVLFVVDAICIKSERFKYKKECIESKYKFMPLTAAFFAAISIPVVIVTLFYAPIIIMGGFVELFTDNDLAKMITFCGCIIFDVVLEISTFVNIYYILKDRDNIVKFRKENIK